jgi:hypothetical protein
MPPLPPRRHEAVPQRHEVFHAISVRLRSAISLPASTAKIARRRLSVTACSCAKSRRPSACTSRRKASSATTLKRRPARASPAKFFCSSWSGGWTVVYRLGFAVSRRQARQLVRHGHIQVNGRKVNIPSFQVSVGEEIAVREGSRKLVILEAAKEFAAPDAPTGWRSTAIITRDGCCRCPSAKRSTAGERTA